MNITFPLIEVNMASDLKLVRAAGRGPWSPEVLAEDAHRLADYRETGKGVLWDEVRAWMQSWGAANERPSPEARKL